jgi:hypothetical protein
MPSRRDEPDPREAGPLNPPARKPEEREGKTSWQDSTSPAADAPLTDDEKDGLSILGGSSVREGSIPGVSDPVPGSGSPRERPEK